MSRTALRGKSTFSPTRRKKLNKLIVKNVKLFLQASKLHVFNHQLEFISVLETYTYFTVWIINKNTELLIEMETEALKLFIGSVFVLQLKVGGDSLIFRKYSGFI